MRCNLCALFATVAISIAAGQSEDSFALLQTAGRHGLEQHAYVRHDEALDRLLDNAENMLKKGASSDVIALAEETLRALKAEVLPMIEEAHQAQTGLLAAHYEAVAQFQTSYRRELEQLAAQREVEANASVNHKACRFGEEAFVERQRECSEELTTLWEKVTELEEDLMTIGDRITQDWCPPGVNTSSSAFRDNSEHHFGKYSAKREKVRVAWKAYNDFLQNCQTPEALLTTSRRLIGDESPAIPKQRVPLSLALVGPDKEETRMQDRVQDQLHDKSSGTKEQSHMQECDILQQELEDASCLGASMADRANRSLQVTWPVVSGALQDTVAVVTNAVESRKHEYTVLKAVECLIEKIQEVGGKPCEEQEAGTNSSAALEIRHCHEISENVTHLDIAIPDLPQEPSAPEAKPMPCSEAFIVQEYSGFPDGVEAAECRACRDS